MLLEVIAESPALRALLLAALFGAVAAASYFAAAAFVARQATRRRLAEEGPRGSSEFITGGSLRSDRAESAWLKLVNTIEKSGLSLVDTKDQAMRKKLAAAGYTAPYAPRVYTMIRLVMVLGLPVLVMGFYWLMGASPTIMQLYFSVMIAAVLGLYIPNLFIRAKASRRHEEIINGFPDALDLMLVCVEAGLGLEAAFARVGLDELTGKIAP